MFYRIWQLELQVTINKSVILVHSVLGLSFDLSRLDESVKDFDIFCGTNDKKTKCEQSQVVLSQALVM